MHRRFLVAALLAALFPLVSNSANAAEREVFTIGGILIDATADGAAAAREIAISEGQKTALDALMRRLTLKEDWPRLPQIYGPQLVSMVQGFEIEEEKNSSTRYLGKLAYTFKPDQVRGILRGSGIPFSETRAKPALILPVYETSEVTVLWGKENPWARVWREKGLEQALAPMILPLGDLADIAALSPLDAAIADWPQLAPLATRYGAGEVLIPVVRNVSDAGGVSSSVRIIRATNEGASEFDVTFTGASEEEALDQAVSFIADQHQENWKRQTIIQFGSEDVLNAAIVFRSFNEWVNIRRRLADVPSIVELKVVGITVEGAQVTMKIAGTLQKLSLSLAQTDLELLDAANFLMIRPKVMDDGASGFGVVPVYQEVAEAVPDLLAPSGRAMATGAIGSEVSHLPPLSQDY